jgi:hypothetical protein
MKRASDYTRELAGGIADLEARRAAPIESAANVMAKIFGLAATVGLGVWWLLALLADCGGSTC